MQGGNNSFVRLGQVPCNASRNCALYFIDGCKTTLVPVLGASAPTMNASEYKQLISNAKKLHK
jgi:hypothetical protein